MRLQVLTCAGQFRHTWMNAKSFRIGLGRPQVCNDRDAPYTKLRWRP